MKRCFFMLMCGLLPGCGLFHGNSSTAWQSSANDNSNKRNQAIVTPDTQLVGQVVRVNMAARFAVVNFPVGKVPGLGQQFGVFRQGLKVGEIKITGPQQDENTVGDISAGEAQIGDELKNN